MKKLIGMTDYVLGKSKIGIEPQSMIAQAELRSGLFHSIIDYANFLKQPLKLGMFIPCDENYVPLVEPKFKDTRNSDLHFLATEKYQQAKENVLFEGFEVDNKENWIYFDRNNDELFTYRKWSKSFWSRGEELKTIEDLVKHNLNLTASAIKKYNI